MDPNTMATASAAHNRRLVGSPRPRPASYHPNLDYHPDEKRISRRPDSGHFRPPSWLLPTGLALPDFTSQSSPAHAIDVNREVGYALDQVFAVDFSVESLKLSEIVEEKSSNEAFREKDSTSDAGFFVSEQVEGKDDQLVYPTGLKLALITCSLMIATFVVALDNAIIATATPRITSQFHSLEDVGWYGSAYMLTTSALQPLFGKVYTYFPIKMTFLGGIFIFEVGSVVCAAATSSIMLIIGRAVAGVGSAIIFSGGMTIVAYTVPLEKRAFYIALLTSMFGLSSIVGPILGGVLTDQLTWRWCFWINLPIGGVAAAGTVFVLREPNRPKTGRTVRERMKELDVVGATILIGAVVCLLLALQWGGITYPWSNGRVWGCLLAFALLTCIFVASQIYLGDRGTIPPRIIRKRTVFLAVGFMGVICMGFQTHVFYLPIYFQAVRGTSAEASGVRTIPYLVSNIIASITVGAAIARWGYYTPFMLVGSAIFAVGSGLLTLLQPTSSTGTWIGYEIVASIGGGICMQIPFVAVQVVLDQADVPVGTALTFFANALGAAIALSAAQNILLNGLTTKIIQTVPSINPAIILGAGAANVKNIVPPELLPAVLEAYNYGLTRALLLPAAAAAIGFVLSVPMPWTNVKGAAVAMAGV